ncbi:hypothetical protein QJQ45_021534 [Haematococcus lacustris]|nr:hypothetical protein QJQ45_021534 [Haematococcus lacustris]
MLNGVAAGAVVPDASVLPQGNAVPIQIPCRRNRLPRRNVRMASKAHEFSLWREDTPIPKSYNPNVVPGIRTQATPLLSASKVVERLNTGVHPQAASHFGAFYSSELGGIVTDPALMVVHMDDHMVHRGHSVFDTASIVHGHVYQLDRHLARFQASAEAAGLSMPYSMEKVTRVILDTAAASKKLNGTIRFWLSAGRGGFGLSVRECIEPSLYVMASSELVPKMNALDRIAGWTACISPVPPSPDVFATIKSTNYLRNALVLQHAESQGFDVGLFVDDEGHVQEGPNMNLAIITQEDVMITPPPTGCLEGVTMQRLIELIPHEVRRSPNDVVIKDIRRRPISIEEVAAAKEVFVTSTTLRVMGIVSLDGTPIADGTPGITTMALDAMLLEDQKIEEGSMQHIAIPWGYVTGMRDQLM